MTFPEPLTFHIDSSLGWHIRAGVSQSLVAEGSGYSLRVGRALMKALAQPPHRAIRQLDPRHRTRKDHDILAR